jgi:uncharacterized FAD-dependent dehydrogenase
MAKKVVINLTPRQAFDPALLKERILAEAGEQSGEVRLLKRSIDARKRPVKVRLEAEVFKDEPIPSLLAYHKSENQVHGRDIAIIVGSGPAGLFAALRLIELGVKPVILERGKDVRQRRRDLAAINKAHIVNPDSNYCFGEGGAGTYSDGKLYTRSRKRGNVRRILEILVTHGAAENILVEAHPHIGTNKLPKVIQSIRESILDAGGEIIFNSRVTDFLIDNGEVKGVVAGQEKITGKAVILATGHSARDIYRLLAAKSIAIAAKSFALGVRVEHPQALIDQIQYHCDVRDAYLPPASYALVNQVNFEQLKRGVFSFCMCPGGFIVPSATAPGEVVVNGMSPSRRDSRFANSGIVVAVEPEDLVAYSAPGALGPMLFQEHIEQKALVLAGGGQTAPAQRLTDFVGNRLSASLPATSYQPGTASVCMDDVLPPFITERLRYAFRQFGKKMKGYLSEEALILGVESRTSAPVQIPRDRDSCEHIGLKRLFPSGEGAGYAGGIVSAAIDGERCAESVAAIYFNTKVEQ